MDLSKPETLLNVLVFIVPGFVWNSTINALVPRKADSWDLSILRFFTLSFINYAICVWLIYLLATHPFFVGHPFHSATAWFAILFVSPAVLGTIVGLNSQNNFFRGILQQLGINTINPIPEAWDYIFSKTPERWILVKI